MLPTATAIIACALLAIQDGGPAAPPAQPDAGQPKATVWKNNDHQPTRELLKRWLAAQNLGRFEDYDRLYAPKFRGLRRSGNKVVSLDRDGWRADRRRMFQKPVFVRVSDVKLSPGSDNIVQVSFVQEFTCGKYRDRGTKSMNVQLVGGEWLITEEVMVDSAKLTLDNLPPLKVPMELAGCSGEYCNCVTSARLRVAVEMREKPSFDSRIVARLKKGAKVENIEFKRIVTQAGIVRLAREGRPRAYYLGYAAEGACLSHDGDQITQISCDDIDEEETEVVSEDWVQITYSGGKVGYTDDHTAIHHGYYEYKGKCVFGNI